MIKIISGCQSGVDRAALFAARDAGLPTGGWAPAGWWTLDGFAEEDMRALGMVEHPETGYTPRTIANVRDSHCTVRIARDFESPGEKCTAKAIRLHKRPSIDLFAGEIERDPEWSRRCLLGWVIARKSMSRMSSGPVMEGPIDQLVINVAGNSESTAPGIFDLAYCFLVQVFVDMV